MLADPDGRGNWPLRRVLSSACTGTVPTLCLEVAEVEAEVVAVAVLRGQTVTRVSLSCFVVCVFRATFYTIAAEAADIMRRLVACIRQREWPLG